MGIVKKNDNNQLANGSRRGLVRSTSSVTDISGYSPTPIINGIPYYDDYKKVDYVEIEQTCESNSDDERYYFFIPLIRNNDSDYTKGKLTVYNNNDSSVISCNVYFDSLRKIMNISYTYSEDNQIVFSPKYTTYKGGNSIFRVDIWSIEKAYYTYGIKDDDGNFTKNISLLGVRVYINSTSMYKYTFKGQSTFFGSELSKISDVTDREDLTEDISTAILVGYTYQPVSQYGADITKKLYTDDELYTLWNIQPEDMDYVSYAFKSDIPKSLKNPYGLTIQGNETVIDTYDGSEEKIINITPSNIGAASSDHTHDNYLPLDASASMTNNISYNMFDNTYTPIQIIKNDNNKLYLQIGSSDDFNSINIYSNNSIQFFTSKSKFTMSIYNDTIYTNGNIDVGSDTSNGFNKVYANYIYGKIYVEEYSSNISDIDSDDMTLSASKLEPGVIPLIGISNDISYSETNGLYKDIVVHSGIYHTIYEPSTITDGGGYSGLILGNRYVDKNADNTAYYAIIKMYGKSSGYTKIVNENTTTSVYTLKLPAKSGTIATTADIPFNYVPTSRTINGKALSSNITLTASDLGITTGSSDSSSSEYSKNIDLNFYALFTMMSACNMLDRPTVIPIYDNDGNQRSFTDINGGSYYFNGTEVATQEQTTDNNYYAATHCVNIEISNTTKFLLIDGLFITYDDDDPLDIDHIYFLDSSGTVLKSVNITDCEVVRYEHGDPYATSGVYLIEVPTDNMYGYATPSTAYINAYGEDSFMRLYVYEITTNDDIPSFCRYNVNRAGSNL